MSAGSQIDWGSNVPIYDPNGKLRAIPQQQMQDALAQPGVARAIPMVDPQGQHHWVHEGDMRDAIANGGRISFPSQEIPKWFGFTPRNMLSNAWSGAKGMASGAYSLGADLVNNPNWFEGSGSTYQKFIGQPAEQQVVRAGQELEQPGVGHKISAAGHALASAVPLVGPWAAGLGEQAGHGDVGGTVGQLAGTYAATKAPEVAGRIANRVIPSTTRAGAGLGALETRYADHPIEPNQFATEGAKIQQELDTVGAKVPAPIKHVMDRIAQADAEGAHGVEGGQGPLGFKEARTILKQFNDQVDFRNPSPTDRLYQRAAGALDQDITTSVAQPSSVAPKGFLPDYLRMANEYWRGKQIIRAGEAAGPFIGGGVGAMMGRQAGGAVAAEAAGAGALAGRYLGKPTVGAATRALIERQGGAPNISLPPEAPAPPAGAAPVAVPPPAPPAEVGAPGGVERRTDIAARQRFAQLSPEEQYQAAYTNHVTGMPNARAFDIAQQHGPAASYGFSDVAGLKWLNDTHGMEAGNALLQAKARALQEAGAASFHTGGDEFTHVSQDPVDLNNRLAAANQNLRNAVIEFRDAKTGQPQYYTGAEFRYGVGASPEQAQAGMMARKAAGKATRGTQGTLRRVPPPAPPPAPVEATP